MAIVVNGKRFTNPQDIREYTRKLLCSAGQIDDEGDWEFRTVNFGLLRFQPKVVYEMQLETVSGWEFVGMADLVGIYARKKEAK
ncbi:hypothetical protein GCM10025857_31720 [Alicyclobacillus contaminans]|uniref:hypothetical protein n=1 Tax=Alicyclobacillus contaminans TaxID=392016 RepID=UPI0003FA9CA9|nr:hypothetical protein [Alicyclobacillus contaminans]GMA51815.1 hypothetical protein GCM10025857_31720 [Alicyclobacillus contaminans]